MAERHHHIATILYQRLKGHAVSSEDEQVLAAWLDKAPENRAIVADLQDEAALRDYLAVLLDTERPKVAFQRFERETLQADTTTDHLAVVHRVHFLKTAWFRYAAVLLLIAGTATYLYRNNRPQKEIAITTNKLKPAEILPGGNKAILTLADGSTIVLDSAADGALAQQGNTKILKLDAGSLAYQGTNAASGEVLYNTISTPKGGQYQIVLPDGSQVWLNAASSIRFPTAFAKERTVSITGEAYFEIAPDKKKAFSVTANGTDIQVLGTSFNVNAYMDEPLLNATLINGSVRVMKGTEAALLKPGQQALVSAKGIQTATANVDKAIAWKNGIFNFEGSSMAEVMRQLSRWYNIEVLYPKGVPERQFIGALSKQVTLESLLKGLEGFDVHFRLEGQRLVILP